MIEELQQGPVQAVHAELGATFAPFSGWNMPVQYSGTVAEHLAVREAVGLFDVSHLGKTLVRGKGAAAFINDTLSNDLGKIAPGKAQYTLCCVESGGVLDDLIAYYVSDDEVFLVPNAANNAAVAKALADVAPDGIEITNQHRDYAVFAVQGPRSDEVLTALGLPTDLEYMSYEDAVWEGRTVRVCRSGYTGEKGFELIPAWADAEALFRALLAPVEQAGGLPAGLGARDTLRTEMGYPLHGNELSLEISPIEARTGWAVGWKKPQFFGREALLAQREAGAARKLWGLKALDRGVLRPGQRVVLDDAGTPTPVGITTSGTFSPSLKVGIALALLDAAAGIEAGQQLVVDVRGRALRVEVVNPPFVAAHTNA